MERSEKRQKRKEKRSEERKNKREAGSMKRAQGRSKRKENRNTGQATGGDLPHMAFIYWSNQEERYELKIDNILKAYSDDDHEAGKELLKDMAEAKGYTVLFG